MATIEEYREMLQALKKDQGELSQALFADFQRIESYESKSSQKRAEEEHRRGLREGMEFASYLLDKYGTEEPYVLNDEMKRIFDTNDYKHIIEAIPAEEVIKNVRQYEKQKTEEEICVGDEVRGKLSGCIGVVLYKREDEITMVDGDGLVYCAEKEYYEKTGKKYGGLKTALKEAQDMLRESN